MKVISTNIAKPVTITWRGKAVQTGIYKKPTNTSIFLKKDDVKADTVVDRKYHGGEFKACYLFSAEAYPYWKKKYPHLEWDWGMFGENLTVEGLNEAQLNIGDVYQLGTALIEITQPREPCYKLGIKFGTQNVLKEFINYPHPGTYIKILEEGKVKVGDTFKLHKNSEYKVTTAQMYTQLFAKEKDEKIIKNLINNTALPQKKRAKMAQWI